jgi:hypothetical protein
MRLSLVILAGLTIFGCDRSSPPAAPAPRTPARAASTTLVPGSTQPAYAPDGFRRDVASLIASKRYDDAVAYLGGADPVRQADHDREGFLAVAWDAIDLPGAGSNEYDPQRDWRIPGTQDAIEHAGWQSAAQAFAMKYNQRRLAGRGQTPAPR